MPESSLASYASKLEEHPEHVRAIGMLTIEIAALERLLANLLAAILTTNVDVAEAIYLSPKGNRARIDILANVAKVRLKSHPRLLKQVEKIISRSRGVIDKRHEIVHSEWRVHPQTGTVMMGKLSGSGRKLEPFPSAKIARVIDDTRKLIVESVNLVGPLEAALRPSGKKST